MKYVSREHDFESPAPKRLRKANLILPGNRVSQTIFEEQWKRPEPCEPTIRRKHEPDTLPFDPRDWARCDVRNWLVSMADTHNIPDLHLERFLMNGKALCLMTLEMYLNRVPLGGKMLYRDFQIRLGRAMWLKNENT